MMLKFAMVILVLALLYAAVFSLMNIMAPRFMMGSVFNTITVNALDKAEYAEYFHRIEYGQRIMGLFGLVVSLCGFILLFIGFRRSKKWAWWTFLFVGLFAFLWGMIYQLWGIIYHSVIISFNSNIPFHGIAILVFMAGLFIPVRSFFAKGVKKGSAGAGSNVSSDVKNEMKG